jgi:hypothetical protein
MTQEIIVLIDYVLRYLSPSEPALQKQDAAQAEIFQSSMSVSLPEMLSVSVWNPHYLEILIAVLYIAKLKINVQTTRETAMDCIPSLIPRPWSSIPSLITCKSLIFVFK